MTEPTPDKRQHPRYPVRVHARISQLGEVGGGVTRDLSRGGMFVETPVPFPVGATLSVRLIHPRTAVELLTVCVVVRQETGTDHAAAGLALRFAASEPTVLRRLDDFLADVAGTGTATAGPNPSPSSGRAAPPAYLAAAMQQGSAAPHAPHPTPPVSSVARQALAARPLRTAVGVLAVVAFLGMAGYVAWTTLVIRGTPPAVIDPAAIGDTVPATSAQVYEGRLYVKVDTRWDALAPAARREALLKLDGWSRTRFATTEVVVSDLQPTLVATVKEGKVELLR